MGMFDKLFGSKPDYPPLPKDNAACMTLNEMKAPLADLAGRVSDHLEVVPAEHEAFVFVGSPPKRFGIAWVHDGKVSGLKEFAEENKLSPSEVGAVIARLGEAYQHASETPRYSTDLGGRKVVVIPSQGLGDEVHEIITQAIH